jgi:H+/Cl- antiporter ClcA
MKRLLNPFTHAGNLWQLARWSLLVVPVAVLAGSASALFLWALDGVTRARWSHPNLLYLLPVGGAAVGLLYHRLGRKAEQGNNLILEEIHRPGGGVPTRMAPLVFVGTLITHLFGGSAGREGTAVQMGGSLAAGFGRWFHLKPENRRVLLLAGVAAGFGSVFGTPLTGAIFAMEVLVVGRVQYDALIPVLAASVVGDATCTAWGIHHTAYHIAFASSTARFAALSPRLLGATVVAGIAFGLTGKLFAELTHALQHLFKRMIPFAPLRPVLGGVLVILLTWALGTRDFLGIGVISPDPHGVSILSAFSPGGANPFSWWWKLLFTAVTLAAGFKGGEVTPLFFIGATLGHVLGGLLGAPVDLFAGLGFIAVFAGAANTPLACTILGVELFGSPYLVYYATACFLAYYFSGHSSIYLAQRLGVPKNVRGDPLPPDLSLREAREIEAGREPRSKDPGRRH